MADPAVLGGGALAVALRGQRRGEGDDLGSPAGPRRVRGRTRGVRASEHDVPSWGREQPVRQARPHRSGALHARGVGQAPVRAARIVQFRRRAAAHQPVGGARETCEETVGADCLDGVLRAGGREAAVPVTQGGQLALVEADDGGRPVSRGRRVRRRLHPACRCGSECCRGGHQGRPQQKCQPAPPRPQHAVFRARHPTPGRSRIRSGSGGR